MLPDDEEGRAQFDALAEVIQGVSLAGGMGRLDDGYRVELGGAYTAPSGDNVYVTGAANLTADGLSLESNLIEGERLSIRWETLLEMLGLSENEIDTLLSLPTTDWDSALNELNDELAQAASYDKYFQDEYVFEVLGQKVFVVGDLLAEALSQLPEDKRDVILLSYFLGMTDREISKKLHVVHQAVSKRRLVTLKELYEYLVKEGFEWPDM